jgi:very-short-patch-repair endonuclease
MAKATNNFTTIRTEGVLLPADLLQRISEGGSIDGLTPASYHRPGEKLNEAINRSWNALQGAWASFKSAQERLPEDDLGTTITRERWLLPLFRELDYGRLQTATAVEIDGRSYPISHGWEHVPVHLVSYKLELDRRTPGAAGAASASPHSLLQVYLNRSEHNLWGFLSNGYKLRILRDNLSLTRQAYVEFDLEAMMAGEVYSDFVLLWLLCHQSRVEGERPSDCWLEKWMKVAEVQGTRALDQLRDGVQRAIEALGLGFIEHPANADLRDRLSDGDLSGQEYYRQLLRIVYRLLFLFVAEDRDLLLDPDAPQEARERYTRFYSTQRLRHVAETFKGTRHPDMYESLRLVMRLLSGDPHPPAPSPSGRRGEEAPLHEGEGFGVRANLLGLVPLGSFLFSDRAVTDIIDCQISNRHLLDAIRALSLVYDGMAKVYRSVDYRNLGPEELGSVYESLLELHPQINVPERRFALATAGGNERKTTGSYYTPTSLINALLDSALDPVLDEAVKGPGKAHTQPPSPALPPHGEGSKERAREMATKAMRDIARDLRQRQTPAEQVLWEVLRKNRLGGLGFRRQHPVANTSYVVDFFCYSANLIVELDGDVHRFQQKEDAQRQSELESLGYCILRFPNQRIIDDLENTLVEIFNAANAPTQPPSPALPPHGEGSEARADKSPHLRGGDLEGGLTPEQRILDLKICDPACGSGHFLIAAANRMAKRLAEVRTGEEEPTPLAIQEAKRDIISHCIYGVDINPMAVELCKVNLWMEALEPGKPLSFLDHRILAGNSLLGTTPRLLTAGIPDDAFRPIEGDDKKLVSTLKKQNRKERKDYEAEVTQLGLWDAIDPAVGASELAKQVRALDALPDDTLDGIRARERRYADLLDSPERRRQKLLADAWCSAFVWVKKPYVAPTPGPSPSGRGETARGSEVLPHEGEGFRMGARGGTEGHYLPPMTQRIYNLLEQDGAFNGREAVENEVARLAERYQFFHWYVAFPDVFSPSPNLSQGERNHPLPPQGEGLSSPPRHEGEGD